MALNCFFGVEIKPDGVPVTPVIPPNSSLVITQCAATSVVPLVDGSSASGEHSTKSSSAAAYAPVTLYVQSHELPIRFAVCTIAPAQNITFAPLQMIFSKKATFSLLPQQEQAAGTSGAAAVLPSVHLTGYFESEESNADEDDDMFDDEEEAEEEEEEPPRAATRGGGGGAGDRAQQQQQRQGKDADRAAGTKRRK